MIVKRTLSLILLLSLLITSSACTYNGRSALNENENDYSERSTYSGLIGEESENMSMINLRGIDKRENKRIVDVLLEGVVDYPYVCTQKDFVFRKNIGDFILVSTGEDEISGTYDTTAYYRLKNNTDEEDYDAVIDIFFCGSKEESHRRIKEYLDSYSMIEVYASNLDVGDFALGGIYRVDFVRGNIYIYVEGYDGVEIGALAKEIDLQILDIINNKERGSRQR